MKDPQKVACPSEHLGWGEMSKHGPKPLTLWQLGTALHDASIRNFKPQSTQLQPTTPKS